MQQLGSVSRMTERVDPVNMYTTFEKPKSVFGAGYGDHRIADPMVRTGPEERTNIPEEEELDEDMIKAVKSLRKVQIAQFDSKKLNWDRWRRQFELQMHANSVPQTHWVQLLGNYLDERSYFVYENWTAQVTGNQRITWRKLAELMGGQYQRKEDVTLAKMKLCSFWWKREHSFFDFSVNLLFYLRTAHPYLDAMALEYLGSDVLCEKIPRRWQVKLDETHQKKPETATFTHDRESCLRW